MFYSSLEQEEEEKFVISYIFNLLSILFLENTHFHCAFPAWGSVDVVADGQKATIVHQTIYLHNDRMCVSLYIFRAKRNFYVRI